MTHLADYVLFRDSTLAARFAGGSGSKIPMTTLFEAYLDGKVDIPDMDAVLDARSDLVKYTLTDDHVKFFFTRMIPEVAIHSKAQDERIVRDHFGRIDVESKPKQGTTFRVWLPLHERPPRLLHAASIETTQPQNS